MSRPRGYAPWRPQAKTLVWLDRVTAVLDAYGAHWPLSVRQVFYRLVTTQGVLYALPVDEESAHA